MIAEQHMSDVFAQRTSPGALTQEGAFFLAQAQGEGWGIFVGLDSTGIPKRFAEGLRHGCGPPGSSLWMNSSTSLSWTFQSARVSKSAFKSSPSRRAILPKTQIYNL
ncbi:hypothetical protein OCEANICA350_12826 [Oceanicaulis sp. 350]|nr:hypothetical protein OCEANICA350_12826 [Oceanicaulis sp. 350]